MKDGKLFGKINIIDLLIVVILIAAVIGFVGRLAFSSSNNISGSDEFQFVVRVDGIREYTVRGLERGGDVFAEKSDVKVGEISDVKVEPMKAEAVTIDGQRKFIERPGRYTAYVTIKAKGNVVNGGYYNADRKDIGAGREYIINSKYVSTKGDTLSVGPIQ